MKVPSPEYLAGFFDGEGCIDVQRMQDPTGLGRFYVRPRVRLAMAANACSILVALQERFGGHLAERKPQATTQQASLSWEILTGADIVRVLSIMEPYLTLKREQARLAIWWLTEHPCRQKKGHDFGDARKVFAGALSAMKRDATLTCEAAVQNILGAIQVTQPSLALVAK